jgi:hypothetical protein
MQRVKTYLVSRFVFHIILLLSVVGCRKANHDIPGQSLDAPGLSTGFFTAHDTVAPVINAAQRFVQGEENRYHFINDLTRRIGWPYWNKSAVSIPPLQSGRAMQDIASTSYPIIVMVPFVREKDAQTNAILCIKMSATDTSFKFLYDWQYIQLGFENHTDSTLTAKSLFQLFSLFDNKIFGTTAFTITDGRLFNRGQTDTFSVSISARTAPSFRTSDGWYINETCVTYAYEQSNRNARAAIVPMSDTYTICSYTIEGGAGYQPSEGGGISGGLSGSGGGGGAGSGSGGSGWGDPCTPTAAPNQPRLNEASVNCGTPGWQPSTYVLTVEDLRIFNEIDAEDAATDALFNKDCQGTNRSGNMAWAGTMEHWIIMIDYIIKNPLSGQIEYQIPEAGMKNGRKGYADIVNSSSGEIFEIKPDNIDGIEAAIKEVAMYVEKAKKNCSMSSAAPWHQGTDYPTRLLPNPRDPSTRLEVGLKEAGVITYRPVPAATNPLPIIVPQTVLDKIKNLIEKLKNSNQPVDVGMAEFLHDPENLELLSFIKTASVTAGVAILVGTIVEDILSGGTGIVDDWSTFSLAFRLIRFGTKL